jgi:LacI family transcriptional regulator
MKDQTSLSRKRPVTLADVALLAGASSKTVSRVVNRDANVSQATRQRVEAAILETGYRVNQAARALAAARSYLIGLFLPSIPSFYQGEILRGAINACRQHGYHLIVEEIDIDAATVVDSYLNGLRGAGCDAFLLAPPVCDDEALLDALDRDGVRYVRVSPAKRPERSTALFADDRQGVEQLVHHLWDHGRRRFALIAGPTDHASALVRESTFAETVEKLGGSVSAIQRRQPEWLGPMAEIGRDATLSLLANPAERPDALFAFNDEAAIGAMTAARDLGLSVPDDISIVGFDDSYVAQLAWPPLTTVHQPIADIAKRAIEIIATQEGQASKPVYLPTHLVVRNSG